MISLIVSFNIRKYLRIFYNISIRNMRVVDPHYQVNFDFISYSLQCYLWSRLLLPLMKSTCLHN